MHARIIGWTLLILLLAGCVPQETGETAEEPVGPPPEEEIGSVNVVYQLLTYSETDTEGETRQFERSFTLPLGEEITRVGEPFPAVTPFGDRTLVKIRNSVGEESHTLEQYVVPGAELGVVVDPNTVLYTRPNLTSPTDDIIPRGSMVAIHPESPGAEFLYITTYDHEAVAGYFDLYVKSEDISTSETDVQAGLLLFVAQQTNAQVARQELLENAEGLGNSAFVDDVRRELAILRGEDPADALSADLADLALEPFDFNGVINANDTTVYRYPDARPEYATTTLDQGALVAVEERTVSAFTVGGKTSSWFRIANPSGWVFGAAIDPE